MVKSTEDIASDDAAAVLNGPVKWRIFPQAEVGPRSVIIRSVKGEDKMCRMAACV